MLVDGTKLDQTHEVAHLLLTPHSTYDREITTYDNISLAFVRTRSLDYQMKKVYQNQNTIAKILRKKS